MGLLSVIAGDTQIWSSAETSDSLFLLDTMLAILFKSFMRYSKLVLKMLAIHTNSRVISFSVDIIS
jgi:hypothetical protein